MRAIPESSRRYIVIVWIKGKSRRVYSNRWRNGFPTLTKKRTGTFGSFDNHGVSNVREWLRQAKYVDRSKITPIDPWPNVLLDSDTGWPDPRLVTELNSIAAALHDKLFITEGTRSYERQLELYKQNMNPTTNKPYAGHPLTAKPGTSNHEDRSGSHYGSAADVVLLSTGAPIGASKKARKLMQKHGLCLPVEGEEWHTEFGNTWRA